MSAHILDTNATNSNETTNSDSLVAGIWIGSIILLNTIGTIGNSLIIMVCLKIRRGRSVRQNSGTFEMYLIALAVIDIVALWTSSTRRLFTSVLQESPEETNAVLCRALPYGNMVASHVATWYVCAMSIDRTYHICCPLQSRKPWVRNSVFVILAAVLSFFILFDMPIALMTKFTEDAKCHMDNDGWMVNVYLKNFAIYHLTMYSFAPFVIILTTAGVIAVKIKTSRNSILLNAVSTTGGKSINSSFYSTITVLLPTAMAFLVCTLPSTAIYLYQDYLCPECSTRRTFQLAVTVCEVLVLVNHSINFIIYGVSGRHFRQTLIHLFKFKRPTATIVVRAQSIVSTNSVSERRVRRICSARSSPILRFNRRHYSNQSANHLMRV